MLTGGLLHGYIKYAGDKMLFLKTLLALAIFLFFPAQVLASTSVTLAPTLDTYVYKAAVNAANGNSSTIVSFCDFAHDNQGLALLKFDLSSIPANATINSAYFSMYQKDSSGVSPEFISLAPVSDNWQNTVTWATHPVSEAAYAGTQLNDEDGYKTWDVKTMIKAWVKGDISNYGFYLKPFVCSNNNIYSRSFYSKEAAQNHPKLVINYSIPTNFAQISPIAKVTLAFNISPVQANISGDQNENLTISDVNAQGDFSSVVISWKTNKPAASYVYYGDAQDGVNRFDKQIGNQDQVTNHTISIQGLKPANTFSYKVMSVDSEASTIFGPIGKFSTLNEPNGDAYGADSISSSTAVSEQGTLSQIKSGVESKIAEYVIQESTPATNLATSEAGINPTYKTMKSNNPVVLFAGWAGTNRIAGVVMIVLGVGCFACAFILFKTGRHIHRHIQKNLRKSKRK
ncbi:MAG TPA: DNRLRE domain-containing protein [Candidatus Levybacteria bacterium]|nr:DNRLRE domain-containing protein [Candidatus Levybacteria bacterium]